MSDISRRGWWFAGWVIAMSMTACREAPAPREAPTVPRPLPYAERGGNALAGLPRRARAAFAPLEATSYPGESDALVDLGRALFHDPRLSAGADLSCASCHPLDAGGSSTGGERDAPSVYNAALRPTTYWDGRASTLEQQVRMSLVGDAELGLADEAEAVRAIEAIPGYARHFTDTFGDQQVTADRLVAAIVAYERRLITPGAFDRYLMDDTSALTQPQAAGLSMFIEAGCMTCHAGATLGMGQQRLGVVEPYPTEDLGVYAVTGRESDRGVFAVPSLRNVARTGPWLHDGSIASLPEVVSMMGRYQLGRELTPEQIQSIVDFLMTLNGEPPARLAGPPLTLP